MVESKQSDRCFKENEQFFPANKWHEDAIKFQQAWAAGDESRLKLAISLADQEHRHPECEKINALAEQRSFCFQHGKITKTAILVIHGWTACPFEMRELGDYLFNKGFNVFGVRLPGHGTSVEDFAKYGRKDWEDSAQKGLGIASLLGHKVVIVGESMGGALAAILAASFPELIQKIILCAPCFKTADWKAEFSDFYPVRHLTPEVDFGVLPDWQRNYWYAKIPITGVIELMKVARKARRVGPNISASTLIIQATNDKLVNPNGAKHFFKTLTKLNRTEKSLILFTGGHHNLTVDLNPRKTEVFHGVTQFIG